MIREAVRIQVFIYFHTWFGYINMYMAKMTLETTLEKYRRIAYISNFFVKFIRKSKTR